MNLNDYLDYHFEKRPDIKSIVLQQGIELDDKADLMDGVAGQIERLSDGSYKISASKDDHLYRRRFTIAHELGHWFLHRPLIGRGVDDNQMFRSVERGRFYNTQIKQLHENQANGFAAKLLMPAHLVFEHYEKSFSGVAKEVGFRRLYHYFRVSPAALRFRLDGLGLPTDQS